MKCESCGLETGARVERIRDRQVCIDCWSAYQHARERDRINMEAAERAALDAGLAEVAAVDAIRALPAEARLIMAVDDAIRARVAAFRNIAKLRKELQ